MNSTTPITCVEKLLSIVLGQGSLAKLLKGAPLPPAQLEGMRAETALF